MDKGQLEIRRLKYAVRTWMVKAVGHLFGASRKPFESEADDEHPHLATMCLSPMSGSSNEEDILKRPEVQQYIESVNATIVQKLEGTGPSPRRVRLSIISPTFKRMGKAQQPERSDKVKMVEIKPHHLLPAHTQQPSDDLELDEDAFSSVTADLFPGDDLHRDERPINPLVRQNPAKGGKRESVLNTEYIKDRALDSQDPEESEKMVSRMIEVQT